MAKVLTFSKLSEKILNQRPKHPQRLIAIDGGGGAGKTTFAMHLQRNIPGSFIVKIDDFYRPPQLRTPVKSTKIINPNFDWERFYLLVLEEVEQHRHIAYQLYDFKVGTLSGAVIDVPNDATIIVEGVWSLQEAFFGYYDFRIWLEAPSEVRLKRGVLRDGEGMREEWEKEWIPIDEHYKNTYAPHLKANLIINNVSSDFQKDKIVLLA